MSDTNTSSSVASRVLSPARRRPLLLQQHHQRRQGDVRLGCGEAEPAFLRADRGDRWNRARSSAATGQPPGRPAVELDDVLAAEPGEISSAGEPRAMTLPWSMIATRSQSRSASSM